MSNRRIAAWALGAAIWTFIAWGSRIDFITSDDARDPWNWIRIGGSLLLGVALVVIAVALWRGLPFTRTVGLVLLTFAGLMIIIWIRSVFSVLNDDESLAFKLVHIVLAAVSIGFGAILARFAVQQHIAQRPD